MLHQTGGAGCAGGWVAKALRQATDLAICSLIAMLASTSLRCSGPPSHDLEAFALASAQWANGSGTWNSLRGFRGASSWASKCRFRVRRYCS